MAIGPVEAALLTRERKVAEDLERYIDSDLREKYSPRMSEITIKMGVQPSERIKAVLIERYLRVGWGEVKWTDEGIFLGRSPANQRVK